MSGLKKLIFVSASMILPTALTLSAATVKATTLVDSPNSSARNTSPNSSRQAPYCLALRGNGESEPAHWGGLASVVEKVGLPRAQSGGSSASMSLFILDNIAANPLVSKASAQDQKTRASLMLKSLYGVALYLGRTPQAEAALDLMKSGSHMSNLYQTDGFGLLKKIISSADLKTISATSTEISQVINMLQELGIGSAARYMNMIPLVKKLATPYEFSLLEIRQLKFYASDLKQALSTFGAFDAESDSGLFLRDGIVDFEKFATQLGKIATFLNGGVNSEATQSAFESFVQLCTPLHANLTWQELVSKEPRCQSELDHSLSSFFAQTLDWNKVNVVYQSLNSGRIASFPSTAVLVGSAYQEAKKAYDDYHTNLDRTAAENFKISNANDVRFGYWGSKKALRRIRKNLRRPFHDGIGRVFNFSRDAKSAKFLPIGEATWFDVLRLSPAEPGLASIQAMTIAGQPAYSAGGWADLHPVLILKASGCDNVVYVTRKGGESMFGQGVAKRLLGYNRSWDKLRTSDPVLLKQNQKLNVLGDKEDLTSAWSLLYNVANHRSSYMQSARIADAVLCTDWDRFDVRSQLFDLVTESYHAPFVVRSHAGPIADDLKAAGAQIVQNPLSKTDGVPDWVGCRGTIQ